MHCRITPMMSVFIIAILLSLHSALYSQPKFHWGRQLGTKSEDFGKSVALDNSGNIFISGWTTDSLCGQNSGGYDIFIYKLNSNSKIIWKRQLGTSSDERVSEIAVDMIGNCFITGWTKGDFGSKNVGDSDIFLTKFDSVGDHLWTRQLGTSKEDIGQYLDIDKSGNVYITGSTKGNLTSENMGNNDVFLIKYDAEGNLLFKQQFGTSESDVGRGISFDNSGNIYVCGMTGVDWSEPNIKNMDAFIAKFDHNGKLIWKKTFGTEHYDVAANLKIDKHGYIFVGGSTGGELGGAQAGSGDAFIAKFDSLANQLWIRQFGRDKWDGVLSVVLAKDGTEHIIIGGCQNWRSCEGYCRRYDESGKLIWVQEFVSQGESGGTCGKDVAIDSLGNCYHIGGTGGAIFSSNKGQHDVYVVKIIDQKNINE